MKCAVIVEADIANPQKGVSSAEHVESGYTVLVFFMSVTTELDNSLLPLCLFCAHSAPPPRKNQHE